MRRSGSERSVGAQKPLGEGLKGGFDSVAGSRAGLMDGPLSGRHFGEVSLGDLPVSFQIGFVEEDDEGQGTDGGLNFPLEDDGLTDGVAIGAIDDEEIAG